MNYKIITDTNKLKEFIDWLPELKDDECYYVMLFARDKYFKELGKPSVKLKRFTSNKELIDLPNLVSHQNESFDWFVKEGLGELLAEISPIDDYTDTKLSLSFKDYHFEEPKTTEDEARANN